MFKYSDEIQIIKVYDFMVTTGELIGQRDAMIAPNTGLPAQSTDIKPPKKKSGHVSVFTDGSWSAVADYRGTVIYSTVTGQPMTITALGELPENSTEVAPLTRFDRWDGSAWVKDEEAERIQFIQDGEVRKKELMQQAVLQIDTLQDAIDLEMASDEEKAQIMVWKKYRVLLNRLNMSSAPDIDWPQVPA